MRAKKGKKKGDFPAELRLHALGVARSRIALLLGQGWTQTKIADAWGISQSIISEWENQTDDKLGVTLLLKLRDALQMSLDDILGLPPLKHVGDGRPMHDA